MEKRNIERDNAWRDYYNNLYKFYTIKELVKKLKYTKESIEQMGEFVFSKKELFEDWLDNAQGNGKYKWKSPRELIDSGHLRNRKRVFNSLVTIWELINE
jgi:nitric oxide synthase oxygenase domain/subunit